MSITGNIILMIKYFVCCLFICFNLQAAQNYDLSFPKDWRVKENSFGADYFAYGPIIINRDSATFFVKEYAAGIGDPIDFIQKDIEKNISINSKKYKNLNIYEKKVKTFNKKKFAVVEYYYFDNTQNKIMFSQISIFKRNSSYIYFNLVSDETSFKEYKDDAQVVMKSLKLKS